MEIIQGIFLMENLVKSAMTAYNKRRDQKGICDRHHCASEPNTERMRLAERACKDAVWKKNLEECSLQKEFERMQLVRTDRKNADRMNL